MHTKSRLYNVCTMYVQVLQNLNKTYFRSFRILIHLEQTIISHFLSLDHSLELPKMLEVLAHVSGNNSINDDLPQCLHLGLLDVTKEITSRVIEELKGYGKMVVLKDGLVVVHDCKIIA